MSDKKVFIVTGDGFRNRLIYGVFDTLQEARKFVIGEDNVSAYIEEWRINGEAVAGHKIEEEYSNVSDEQRLKNQFISEG